ncbi:unnamed protein product [Schistosoma curassoni]|uniref:Protein kinase domain-containing protein n=1 Tax=Schistosoma curassoni TaxID=6186 RepID=A0A183JE60_9TREM|nr:unnamed protein product [Schistosoma curassoni]
MWVGLRSQDNLSLNKYVLPTYRQENSFVKYITLENHSNSNSNSNSTNSLQQQQHRHQTYQRNQKQSLLLQNSDLNTSKSQVLNTTTTTTTTNSTDSNHNPLLTRSIHYEIDQNDKSKSINITTTTTAGTTSSITTTNSSVDNLSDHLISSTKHLSKLVPPLIGLNEIHVNDSQTLQHDLCISSSNNDNDNDDDHDDDDDDDDLSNPCHSQRDQSISNNNNNDLLINNHHHHHNHWQDSIQSTCWLPKVAMNSNRTKCDEILSTNWNLLTMKNWKSDQELKRKMGLLNPYHHNKLGRGGGFWFREKAFNHTKSFIPGRRRIEQQQQQQQSKGMSFSAIVNHCPLINQYLPSNKVLHCQFDTGPMEQTEIFSLPEAKSKFSIDNSLLNSNRISSIHNINTTNNTTNTTTTTTNSNNKKVKNTKSLIQSNNDSMDDFNKTIKCKFNQLQSDTNDTSLSSLLSIQNTQHFITKYPDTKLYLNEKAPATTTTTTTIMNGSNVIQQSKDNLSLKINQPNEYTPSLSSSRRYQHTALNIYGKKLTSYEREEILNFNKIWYLGLSAQKIDAIQGSPSNHGYDDETGGYLKSMIRSPSKCGVCGAPTSVAPSTCQGNNIRYPPGI